MVDRGLGSGPGEPNAANRDTGKSYGVKFQGLVEQVEESGASIRTANGALWPAPLTGMVGVSLYCNV